VADIAGTGSGTKPTHLRTYPKRAFSGGKTALGRGFGTGSHCDFPGVFCQQIVRKPSSSARCSTTNYCIGAVKGPGCGGGAAELDNAQTCSETKRRCATLVILAAMTKVRAP
jgi:hypothetical protein